MFRHVILIYIMTVFRIWLVLYHCTCEVSFPTTFLPSTLVEIVAGTERDGLSS